ncbi:hypothetical protein G7Y89_g15540 [Cudoniella acicularis]|uniref:Uncharacterized protein n=1 Tax=Cudoniella acicularis TaxID=354080 RepID=A0A8H4QL14_9HELO|nr:hypothetical protein G7Y89_g15540 [Cudoniella acicularis]
MLRRISNRLSSRLPVRNRNRRRPTEDGDATPPIESTSSSIIEVVLPMSTGETPNNDEPRYEMAVNSPATSSEEAQIPEPEARREMVVEMTSTPNGDLRQEPEALAQEATRAQSSTPPESPIRRLEDPFQLSLNDSVQLIPELPSNEDVVAENKHNPSSDTSNTSSVAELLHHHQPQLPQLHNYVESSTQIEPLELTSNGDQNKNTNGNDNSNTE